MPPPIDEEEVAIPCPARTRNQQTPMANQSQDLEPHEALASSPDEGADLDPAGELDFTRGSSRTQQSAEDQPEPKRQASPVLVVSDIVTTNVAPTRTALPSLKPSEPERRSMEKGKKRAKSTLRSTSGVRIPRGPPTWCSETTRADFGLTLAI